ncbi:unnamed protein product [Fraxinus pennsylvanica]|uniref:Uncharacterized protein n=1 Tax=Fraxinus pennsylvanica TaxID=56036 RepID=A0AAD2AIP7_9LAMI|nr:unnamed protein product [Fraxinus pennsylvanica]
MATWQAACNQGTSSVKITVPQGKTYLVKQIMFEGPCKSSSITFEGGSGFARDISFSDITLIAVDNPIIINQFYCNGRVCPPTKVSNFTQAFTVIFFSFGMGGENAALAVKVSDVTYTGIQGTTICKNASINFSCSDTVPCTNIILNNINIAAVAPNPPPHSLCMHAQVTAHLTVPPVNCQAHI